MKKELFVFITSLLPTFMFGMDIPAFVELNSQFDRACREETPMHEHVPVLKNLAMQCSSVVEIGIYDMVSSWGILRGLAESHAPSRSYVGIDIRRPPEDILNLAQNIAEKCDISFKFIEQNDMEIDIEPAELLFIDSLHTYSHLSYELEKFSSKITKFIAMHDTSDPWGSRDDDAYTGDYSEYPSSINTAKRGLWNAVTDFLAKHPEWELYERRFNCYGFTILKRK